MSWSGADSRSRRPRRRPTATAAAEAAAASRRPGAARRIPRRRRGRRTRCGWRRRRSTRRRRRNIRRPARRRRECSGRRPPGSSRGRRSRTKARPCCRRSARPCAVRSRSESSLTRDTSPHPDAMARSVDSAHVTHGEMLDVLGACARDAGRYHQQRGARDPASFDHACLQTPRIMVHPAGRRRAVARLHGGARTRSEEDARVSCPSGRPLRNFSGIIGGRIRLAAGGKGSLTNESHLRIVPSRGQARRPGPEGALRRSRRNPRLLPAARGTAPRIAPVTVVSRRRALDRGPPSRRRAVRVSPAAAGRGPRGQGDPRAPGRRPATRSSPAGARSTPSTAAPQARSGLVARLHRSAVPASIAGGKPAARPRAGGDLRATGSVPRSGRTR